MPPSENPQALTIWQDIEIRLPASWEMIRYGLRHRAGACVFADPYGERLHLAWQRDVGPPAIERVLSDIRAYERNTVSSENAENLQFFSLPLEGAWQGWIVRGAGIHKARAVRWWTETRTLLEVAFLSLAEGEEPLEVLRGINVRSPGTFSHWRCFGLDVEIPSSWTLVSCRCLPGDVELRFQAPSGRAVAMVRRMAFPSLWLRTPLPEWLRRRRVRPWAIEQVSSESGWQGHERAVMLSGRRELPWCLMPAGRRRRVEVLTMCETEKHAYYGMVEWTLSCSDPIHLQARCPCGVWFDAAPLCGWADDREDPKNR